MTRAGVLSPAEDEDASTPEAAAAEGEDEELGTVVINDRAADGTEIDTEEDELENTITDARHPSKPEAGRESSGTRVVVGKSASKPPLNNSPTRGNTASPRRERRTGSAGSTAAAAKSTTSKSPARSITSIVTAATAAACTGEPG